MAYELSTIGDAASGLPTGAWPTIPVSWVNAPSAQPADVTYDAAALLAVGLFCLLAGAGAVYAYEKGYF